MSAPLEFLDTFAGKLREAGIRFAITSGMACVHYGLQQTTKDSDWIIPPDDMGKLCELLMRLPPNPVDAVGREAILARALHRATVKAQTTLETLILIQPPLEEMLP